LPRSSTHGVRAWHNAVRVFRKSQKGIRCVAPDTIDDVTVTRIKPVSVVDVTQTQARTQRIAA
jgi:hypothetical protein